MNSHPNATVGGIAGLGGGELILTVAHQFGWDISPGWAVIAASATSAALLFIGRNGLAGVWALLKHGTGQPNGKETP